MGAHNDFFGTFIGHRHVDHDGRDRAEEDAAGHNRSKAKAAILGRLGHDVAKRGA